MRPFDEKLVHAQASDGLRWLTPSGRCILPLNLWMRSSVSGRLLLGRGPAFHRRVASPIGYVLFHLPDGGSYSLESKVISKTCNRRSPTNGRRSLSFCSSMISFIGPCSPSQNRWTRR